MKRFFLLGVSLFAVTASINAAMAAEPSGWTGGIPGPEDGNGLPGAWVFGPIPGCDPTINYDCKETKAWDNARRRAAAAAGTCDPYVDYKCLDAYLGDDPASRFIRYYQLEWGHATAPADPHAPAASRPDALVPPTPQTVPPMPFAEWPYGGTQNIGKTIPNAIDSPLMVAIANTQAGKWLSDNHIQIYGWLDPAGNISSNNVRPGGNFPVSYDYTPNALQLDQAVLYVERVPDEVQNDHFDWGFRVSGIYGVDYRYTTAYGLFSNQLLKANATNGADMPMVYVDLYYPVMQGLNIRIGRFISIPDIEAQLAPNNYTYAHSLTYTFDNYTNTGVEATLALTKNWILQMGSTIGTEAMPWHWGQTIPNLWTQAGNADPLYPGTTMLKDPGAVPSFTFGVRWTSSDGKDDVNIVADGINGGQWGYNNLQWYGFTYYHKLDDYWHFAFETWNIHNNNVLNLNSAPANAILAGGGTPFSPQFIPFNAPGGAWCSGASQFGNTAVANAPLTCSSDTQTALLYVNYSPDKLNNFSLRTEYMNDRNGQRTGVPTQYMDVGLSWQHWLSPQVEARPEIAYYRSLDNAAFNTDCNAGICAGPPGATPGARDWAVIAAGDLIWHF
jgi:Putative beta-barrel porin-2, OmpL-like. bbp2